MTRRSPAREPVPNRSRGGGSSGGGNKKNPYATLALGGAIFILGIGVGVTFGTVSPNQNVITNDSIDKAAPNREFCIQYGSSAMVMNNRVYVTLRPFAVHVAQAVIEPGCVIRSENWNILQSRNLVNNEDVRRCKANMNTFAYTGDLDKDPRVECVYQSGEDRNLFDQFSTSTPPPTR